MVGGGGGGMEIEKGFMSSSAFHHETQSDFPQQTKNTRKCKCKLVFLFITNFHLPAFQQRKRIEEERGSLSVGKTNHKVFY